MKEATQQIARESLELLRRFPKHAGVLKLLGLDNLPPRSIIVVGKDRIDVILPTDEDLKSS